MADLLLELRQSRMGLIQTSDQLFFSYQAIIEGIKHLNDPVRNRKKKRKKYFFRVNFQLIEILFSLAVVQ